MELEGTWYTTAQAARELGIAHDTVRSAIRLGTLRAVRVTPRLNMVPAAALEEYRRAHLGRTGRRPRRTDKATSEHEQDASTDAAP